MLGGGVERGVGHAERPEDPLGEELVERLAGDDLDDPPEDVGRHRVQPLGAGLEGERQAGPGVAARGEVHARRRAPLEAVGAVDLVDGVRVVEAVREPRRVRHQVPDPHRRRERRRERLLRRAAQVDPRVGERRDEARDGVVQLERALLPQQHRRDRRDRLRHRVDPPERVGLDGGAGLEVALAGRGDVRDPSVARHDRQVAGQAAVVDVAGEVAVDALQAPGVEAELGRVGLGGEDGVGGGHRAGSSQASRSVEAG